MIKNSIYTLLFIFLSATAHAENQSCLSGDSDKTQLIDQLATAQNKSEISKAIAAKYNLKNSETTEADAIENCPKCLEISKASQASINLSQIKDLSKNKSPKPLFKDECLSAVAQIKTSTNQLLCPSGEKTKKALCVTNDMYQYQAAVLNEFYQCVKAETNFPVTPEVLFEMYALESGFRPNYAYGGGVGVGQLTSIFVKDIHQKHRGQKFLKQIESSKNENCKIAQPLAAKDLKKQPSLKNRCDFIQYGEGFERNTLYTLVGLANSWERDIEPKMRKFNEKNKTNPALPRSQQLALMNAYGSGGRAAARAALKRLTNLEPAEFIEAIQKPMKTAAGKNLTEYTSKMKSKQDRLTQFFKAPAQLDFANNGARSCIDPSL